MRVSALEADFRTVWMEGSPDSPMVRMIDQNRLPFRFAIHDCRDVPATCNAINRMTVRGAGAIGATAAFGMAQGFREDPVAARTVLEATRPTARNLFYGIETVYDAAIDAANPRRVAWQTAQEVADYDARACRQIGEQGAAELIGNGTKILTHCNAGWLAFVDWGSALSPIYVAHRSGKHVKVFADETRPRMQGARLTAWELQNEGVEHEIVADGGVADLLQHEKIDLIIVGADRIAANGDTANKIGTHTVAIVARHFEVPFYVAAPTSTIDLNTSSGQHIPIESRSPEELTHVSGETEDGRFEKVLSTNPGSLARNRAFDVTPSDFITGIITEHGIIRPNAQEILAVKKAA